MAFDIITEVLVLLAIAVLAGELFEQRGSPRISFILSGRGVVGVVIVCRYASSNSTSQSSSDDLKPCLDQ